MKLSDRLTSHWAYRAIRWTLGIVFFYAGGSKLMDPQASLRDIHPLVESIQNEKDALTPLMDSLPDGDELKDVLNNALVS